MSLLTLLLLELRLKNGLSRHWPNPFKISADKLSEKESELRGNCRQ